MNKCQSWSYFSKVDNVNFKCLNRNDIPENALRKVVVFGRKSVKRVNLYDYFNDHNETHIICGENSLKKFQCGLIGM